MASLSTVITGLEEEPRDEEEAASSKMRRRDVNGAQTFTDESRVEYQDDDHERIYAKIKRSVYSTLFNTNDVIAERYFSPYASIVRLLTAFKDYLSLVRHENAVHRQVKIVDDRIVPLRRNSERHRLTVVTTRMLCVENGLKAYRLGDMLNCQSFYRQLQRYDYYINAYERVIEICDTFVEEVYLSCATTSISVAMIKLGSISLPSMDDRILDHAQTKLTSQFIGTVAMVDKFDNFLTGLDTERAEYTEMKLDGTSPSLCDEATKFFGNLSGPPKVLAP